MRLSGGRGAAAPEEEMKGATASTPITTAEIRPTGAAAATAVAHLILVEILQLNLLQTIKR